MSKLKPCPFCGYISVQTRLLTAGETFRVTIECDTCLACGPVVSSERGQEDAERLAVVLWNSRVGESDTAASGIFRTKYDPERGWYTEPVNYWQEPVEEWVEAEEPGIYRTNIIAPDKLGPSEFQALPAEYTVHGKFVRWDVATQRWVELPPDEPPQAEG